MAQADNGVFVEVRETFTTTRDSNPFRLPIPRSRRHPDGITFDMAVSSPTTFSGTIKLKWSNNDGVTYYDMPDTTFTAPGIVAIWLKHPGMQYKISATIVSGTAYVTIL